MAENNGKTVKTVRIAVVLWPIGSPRPMLILPVPVSVKPKKIRSLEKPRIKNLMSVAKL